ncbi:MAG: GlmU family protein [Cytophagales bacterium]|nr:GlmU family protein [Cytophagales bacterium]
MNLVLFDDPATRIDLMPFTLTRPVGSIRVGIHTIQEKWERLTGQPVYFATEDYLAEKFPSSPASDNLFIHGALCPDASLLSAVQKLEPGQSLVKDKTLLASRSSDPLNPPAKGQSEYEGDVTLINNVWKIFQLNAEQLRNDFNLLTQGRKSSAITDPHTTVYAPENIFLEEGVKLHACVLNATGGPIYLGKNSEVQEGAVIRGPFSLGEDSVVNMGAKIRGDTTVGPQCKVGGEINNVVFFARSNKAHDGFLGNSVIGEWCNLGADTNNSNLKNNYESVKIWNYRKKGFLDTGLMFCGLMMGDHSKCGINTMFNTGTVVGVSANIFGDGFPRNFIPSFSWGGAAGFSTFQLQKVFQTAERVMQRRNLTLTETDKKILSTIFERSAAERVWEKKL